MITPYWFGNGLVLLGNNITRVNVHPDLWCHLASTVNYFASLNFNLLVISVRVQTSCKKNFVVSLHIWYSAQCYCSSSLHWARSGVKAPVDGCGLWILFIVWVIISVPKYTHWSDSICPCQFLSDNITIYLHFYHLSLQWRHDECDSVSNQQPHHCLLNRLFRRKSKKTSMLRVTGLCAGKSPETGEFSAQMASNAEKVSIWWRHYATLRCHR